MSGRSLGLLSITLLVSGCANVDPHEGFTDVVRTVEVRSGQTAIWKSGSAAGADAHKTQQLSAAEFLKRPLTADNAVRLALLNNPGLQASYAEMGLRDAEATQASLLRNPFFHTTVQFPRAEPGRALDIGVSWDVLGLLTLSLRQAAATEARHAARLQAASDTLQLAARTRAAWYATMASREGETWLAQMDEASALSAAITQRLTLAGNLPPMSDADTQALRLESRFALEDALAASEEAQRTLSALLGLPNSASLLFPDTLPRLPESDPTPRVDLETHHLELAQLEAQLVQARKQTAANARTTWTDSVELGWSWDRESTGEWKDGPSLGVTLPLFDTGQARRYAAGFEVERLEARLVERRLGVAQEAQQLQSRMTRARTRVEQLRETLLPLLSNAQDAALLEYNGMLKSPTYLLNLKHRELAAIHQLVQGLNDYWQARTALEALNMGVSLAAATPTRASSAPATATSGGH